MQLQKCLSSETLSMETLDHLIKASQASISRFGSRVLTVKEYEGSICLADVAQIAKNFANRAADTRASLKERAHCLRAIYTLRSLYKQTDSMLASASLIVKLFAFLQTLLGLNGENTFSLAKLLGYPPRLACLRDFIEIEEDEKMRTSAQRLHYMLKDQLQKDFPKTKLEDCSRSSGGGKTEYLIPRYLLSFA